MPILSDSQFSVLCTRSPNLNCFRFIFSSLKVTQALDRYAREKCTFRRSSPQSIYKHDGTYYHANTETRTFCFEVSQWSFLLAKSGPSIPMSVGIYWSLSECIRTRRIPFWVLQTHCNCSQSPSSPWVSHLYHGFMERYDSIARPSMHQSFIGSRLIKTRLTLINRTQLRTKGQSAGYPHFSLRRRWENAICLGPGPKWKVRVTEGFIKSKGNRRIEHLLCQFGSQAKATGIFSSDSFFVTWHTLWEQNWNSLQFFASAGKRNRWTFVDSSCLGQVLMNFSWSYN